MPLPDSVDASARPRHWDIFCRVIDNHGDLGVCWRLARQLAAAGQTVRLWCDDASALAWMAPQRPPGIEVLPWREPLPHEQPGDVVIEAFGCDPPAAFVERMAAAQPAPVWINLEYLSAEDYVERSHGLASPQFSGPGGGLTKWFVYPGLTARTGGLLREPDLPRRQAAFDADAWLQSRGIDRRHGERLVSVFAYDAAPLTAMLPALSGGAPLHLLACPGPAQADALAVRHPSVRVTALPWLTQDGYDELLWACDLNLVRGEDSFVRALWSGRPFLWQIYPQDDGAHVAKLQAFLHHFLTSMPASLADAVHGLHGVWNGLPARSQPMRPSWPEWHAACAAWRSSAASQDDLLTRLQRFIADKAMSAREAPSG